LDLDEWPPGHLAVMAGLGNQLANSVWEARILPPYRKPGPDSPRWELQSYMCVLLENIKNGKKMQNFMLLLDKKLPRKIYNPNSFMIKAKNGKTANSAG
jgi:hypothetical protein